jgi:WD40 repeat protein
MKGRPMLLFEDHRSQSSAIDHKAVVYAVAFSPDGSTLATGAKDGSLLLRDAAGHVSSLRERGIKAQPVHAIDFLPASPRDLSPAEPGFTAAPSDSGVIIGGEFGWSAWRLEDGVWREFRSQSNRPVTSLAVLNERLVAFGIGDRLKPTAGTFELWDISADRKLPHNFHEPNGVRAIAACPAKKLVAWVTGHRKVLVWDVTSPTKPTAYPQPGACPAVALSADGKSMAVAVDWTTKIYDVEKKRERLVLKGHKGQVHAVAFSPDGRTLMTGSWDFTVRLWDVATGKERANYNWDIGRVYCATYAPDGLRLAAGGDLGRVVVWDAE